MSNVLFIDIELTSEECRCKSSTTQIISLQIHMQGTVNQLTFCQSEISFHWQENVVFLHYILLQCIIS